MWTPSQVAATLVVALQLAGFVDASSVATTVCSGYDEEWGACEKQPVCNGCTPQDCKFGAWADWYEAGGCAGLRFRHREVSQRNNECGTPCAGPKIQSVRHLKPECEFPVVNCAFGPWDEWTRCPKDSTFPSSSFRTRVQIRSASHGGTSCVGPLSEARECDAKAPPVEDCLLSEWREWTTCSKTCGDGVHTRARRVLKRANALGKPCIDPIQEVEKCNMDPKNLKCTIQPCVMSLWSEWSACEGNGQRYRTRHVVTPAANGGVACDGSMKETSTCLPEHPQPCVVSAWTAWEKCDMDCRGQTFRTRSVLHEPKNGGKNCAAMVLSETRGCNNKPGMPCAPKPPKDCVMEKWSMWSDCSVTCGVGQRERSRGVRWPAKDGGKGCTGETKHMEPCMNEKGCDNQDCLWGDWTRWSACSCTCGGGTRKRSRVVKSPPREYGKLCDAMDKEELGTCNTGPCDAHVCVDAKWGSWDEWSKCSAACSDGFQVRHREVEQEANSCGKSLTGQQEEYRKCTQAKACVPDVDCLVGSWSEWSTCSCSCFGSRERNRQIARYAQGNGKQCVKTSLSEIAPCNPGPKQTPSPECGLHPRIDCGLSVWAQWSDCSRTCGGGQRVRSRTVAQEPRNGGAPCDYAELTQTEGCSEDSCRPTKCMDCKMAAWSEWSDCSRCGDQRYRYRHISQLPNHCGKACSPAGLGTNSPAVKETSNCTSACKKRLFCVWSEWSAGSGCEEGCLGNLMRIRSLGLTNKLRKTGDFLFAIYGEAPEAATCTGQELSLETCDRTSCLGKCEPQDCVFSLWSDWEAPTCLGLCERKRHVLKAQNSCGRACEGNITETKHCPTDDLSCQPVDCVLTAWSEWDTCSTPNGQSIRTRSVRASPINGGKPCEAILRMTRPCGGLKPVPCKLAEWEEWGHCSTTCEGLRTRVRKITPCKTNGYYPAKNSGSPCTGNLKDLEPCGGQCPIGESKPCIYSAWSAWSTCNEDRQRTRERGIKQEAVGVGRGCMGSMLETQTCDLIVTDCQMSPWTTWDKCDKDCGSGQQARHRQINVYPQNGGKQCPEVLMENQGCNLQPCNTGDCVVGDWNEWGKCSATCNAGQQGRSRVVIKPATGLGNGCAAQLSQMRPCDGLTSCIHIKDCVWGDWTPPSTCSLTCGGGQTVRTRQIVQTPSVGGKPCVAEDRESIAPCNTQACEKIVSGDGRWGDWTKWSPCSATCKSGTRFRTRKIAEPAKGDGTPAYGEDNQLEFCNTDVVCQVPVDCVFAAWNDWSACSASCTGVKRRSRGIKQFGRGAGAYCIGPVQETWPCNPSAHETTPKGCGAGDPTDQVISEWQAWSTCSATCGGGQRTRVRHELTSASDGGKNEKAELSQTQECAREPCKRADAVDCKVGEWGEWGSCSKCGGLRKRFRYIVTYAQYGGENCPKSVLEEVGACPIHCEKDHWCTWQDWGNWGSCSTKCGPGRRSRSRNLALSAKIAKLPVDKAMLKEYEALQLRSSALEAELSGGGSNKVVALAFCGGFMSFALVMGAYRLFGARASSRPPAANLMAVPMVEQTFESESELALMQ
eukprot:TRINITY_DN3221_c0_g1_i3.p1 TRINITY_DN3221_c0_g1~~TRINITY_DN3221_c0_g1_i3.p1  ORF type:complete len:1556 (+),score=355.20 TRINITY_DN3221_c0_g1_i3:87-4754(+)